jgi:hypothetical protein
VSSPVVELKDLGVGVNVKKGLGLEKSKSRGELKRGKGDSKMSMGMRMEMGHKKTGSEGSKLSGETLMPTVSAGAGVAEMFQDVELGERKKEGSKKDRGCVAWVKKMFCLAT